MDTEGLLSGIAVVIDDEIGSNGDTINNLIEQIEKQHIPCLTFKTLPELESVEHLGEASLLLLDWLLTPNDPESGVTVPTHLQEAEIRKNIEFLKALRATSFIPIFIFTNEDPDVVIRELESNGLYDKDNHNHILVKRKSDLEDNSLSNETLLKEVLAWIKSTPTIYLLRSWNKEYRRARTELFHYLYGLSPSWPSIMWQAFEKDGVNGSLGLGDMISKNLNSRMAPFQLDESLLETNKGVSQEELRGVLQGERFIPESNLHEGMVACGDTFEHEDILYLNIRPDCDCIPRKSGEIDEISLYFLEGTKVTASKEGSSFMNTYGIFPERDNEAIVFSMYQDDTYRFSFKELQITKVKDCKGTRIGRLLHPFLNRIQQRYSYYLQRQALPRIPEHAVPASQAEKIESNS